MNDKFEKVRAELLADRENLVSTAKDYLRKNLFAGQSENIVSSIIGKYTRYGYLAVTQKMWHSLAGCVAYVDIRDRDGEEE